MYMHINGIKIETKSSRFENFYEIKLKNIQGFFL